MEIPQAKPKNEINGNEIMSDVEKQLELASDKDKLTDMINDLKLTFVNLEKKEYIELYNLFVEKLIDFRNWALDKIDKI